MKSKDGRSKMEEGRGKREDVRWKKEDVRGKREEGRRKREDGLKKQDMGKEESDILYFVSFCLEQYKMQKGLSGSEALNLFDKNGVTEYLAKHYDVLHTQGASWLMHDIDEHIKN